MQSIIRFQHAFNSCNPSYPFLSIAQYTLASFPWRASTYTTRNLSKNAESQHHPNGGPTANNSTLASLQRDSRKRLSAVWSPTGGIEASESTNEDSHSLLVKGGFLRQAHAGLFQLLPMGLRIQDKLEKLLDKHMERLGASKVSLSTLSSQDLWKRTGRIPDDGRDSPEIFQVQDRKEATFILSPTHEEEITSLVGSIVKSYKDLPLRLYQVTRKYRDEARPRQGLLRTREFLMKDLYTFDVSSEGALESYEMVRTAYSSFFHEFKIPYLVAKAASGEMGGDLSHEFHFPTSKGEDNIVTCDKCGYVVNEELAAIASPSNFVSGPDAGVDELQALLEFANNTQNIESADGFYRQWLGCSKDRETLIQAIYPTKKALLLAGYETSEESQINPKALQQTFPYLDMSIETSQGHLESAKEIHRVYDATIVPPSELLPDAVKGTTVRPGEVKHIAGYSLKGSYVYQGSQHLPVFEAKRDSANTRSLLKIANGNRCTQCEKGRLSVQPAVELGHNFHLGTRYTKPLNATVALDPVQRRSSAGEIERKSGSDQVFLQMGCHGIGVSRLIAAAADALADSKGLNWPRVMAPFEAVVVPTNATGVDAQTQVYDVLTDPQRPGQGSIDVILDDRQRQFGWKLADADMIGYPVIVVIGRGWKEKNCEVQCRRLGIKQEVHVQELRGFVEGLLDKL